MGLTRLPVPLLGVYYLPPRMSDTLSIVTPAWRDNKSTHRLTDLPLSEYTDVVGTWEKVSKDPNLDHFHNEDSDHFPELGMDQSWLIALFSPFRTTFENLILIPKVIKLAS